MDINNSFIYYKKLLGVVTKNVHQHAQVVADFRDNLHNFLKIKVKHFKNQITNYFLEFLQQIVSKLNKI